MTPLILASASPRRLELLTRLGVSVLQEPVSVDETMPARATAVEAARACEELAARKVRTLLETSPDRGGRWVLGADTIIWAKGRVIGKPSSREEAALFLRSFSGASHLVITGVALHNPSSRLIVTACERARVTFNPLNGEDLRWYLDSGEWADAAGGYKIQGRGECLIARISGSYSTVMGLPLSRVYGILAAEKFPLF